MPFNSPANPEHHTISESTFFSLHPQPNTLRCVEGTFLDCCRLLISTNMMQVSGLLFETRRHEMKLTTVAQTNKAWFGRNNMLFMFLRSVSRPTSNRPAAPAPPPRPPLSKKLVAIRAPAHVYPAQDAIMFTCRCVLFRSPGKLSSSRVGIATRPSQCTE